MPIHATFADNPVINNKNIMLNSTTMIINTKQFIEGIKKFIFIAENPNLTTNSGYGLSDLGFILLQLKESLVTIDQRYINVAPEFASKQYSGLTLLLKTVVILQGIVQNSIGQKAGSKITQLLNKKNNSTTSNIKRKASVCEADCIECIKIVLEKVPPSWRIFLDNQHNLEIIIHSINSPQLDSKCYSLEIILQLLDHENGFEQLFKSLTIVAARVGEYQRLSIFTKQLKHGLHTNKLHIQILIAKFMNKLLLMAPSTNYKLLSQSEALIANYSPEYIRKLLSNVNGPLIGLDLLNDELGIWLNLLTPIDKDPPQSTKSVDSSLYDNDYSYNIAYNSNTSKSRKNITSLAKNVERHKYKKYNDITPPSNNEHTINYNQNNSSLKKKRHDYDETPFYPNQIPITIQENLQFSQHHLQPSFNTDPGKMRRVKSESAMNIEPLSEEDSDNDINNFNLHNRNLGNLKNYNNIPSIPIKVMHSSTKNLNNQYEHPSYTTPNRLNNGKIMSKSINDLSFLNTSKNDNLSYQHSREGLSQKSRQSSINIIPASQMPHGGFSYLFPNAPVVDRVASPGPLSPRPLSVIGKSGPTSPNYNNGNHIINNKNSGNVVYIPIQKQNTLERKKAGFLTKKESFKFGDTQTKGGILKTESMKKTPYSEEVKDALSQFDYLNDYEESSTIAGSVVNPPKSNHTIYHF
ncbi:Armadillo-type fold domain-containing protein [Strongyloides ratti]|uniref:Armadillo-type fold domain-containing protein n=1 Tax=Strongyloides ratti TaxID=34506 RepID=A0A090LNI8_STRRB|nr:Armadillo-type fold domain-containing protein [Strongyloides ratti]CEF69095.1 Armadillo-type fold domain-containing protein [Strongyloides ratti]